MEETLNAVRNLNGTKVRGKILEVSFAKYDRHDLRRSSEAFHEEDDKGGGDTGLWRPPGKVLEVVEGRRLYTHNDVKEVYDRRNAWISNDDKTHRNLGQKCLKGMVWNLLEEIFNPSTLEEAKHKLELVVFNTLKMVRRDEDAMLVPHAC